MPATEADLNMLRARAAHARKAFDDAEAARTEALQRLRRAHRALRVAMGEPDSSLEPDDSGEVSDGRW